MLGRDPSSRSALCHWGRKSAFVMFAVGILSFVLWTLPNWDEFWRNVAQFPTLWQLPANRRIIIYLTIKIVSPLLLMGMVAIMLWLYSLSNEPQRDEGTPPVRSEPLQRQMLPQEESRPKPSLLQVRTSTATTKGLVARPVTGAS